MRARLKPLWFCERPRAAVGETAALTTAWWEMMVGGHLLAQAVPETWERKTVTRFIAGHLLAQAAAGLLAAAEEAEI